MGLDLGEVHDGRHQMQFEPVSCCRALWCDESFLHPGQRLVFAFGMYTAGPSGWEHAANCVSSKPSHKEQTQNPFP